ncbi:DNA-binding XRE family transcriptional regulator [Tenacibaculum sp. 190524A02b]|uniref:DNA-binding XRE family transcriptional regulator n=1 Tax=Tenacibaculum vairaonense TaxID=3137860 RepID=A0ABP1FIC9_9FLAO
MNHDHFIIRLKEVIKFNSLTLSTFADTIEVPRSSLSHLMSGRNKPSLDFVLKIIAKFPEVDLYWLLNGEGSFPKQKESLEKIETVTEEKEEIETPSLFAQTTTKQETISNTQFSAPTEKQENVARKKLVKVILLYNDGSFDEYTK